MPLSLKNFELERLARRRAKRRGESLTQAVLSALRDAEQRETIAPTRRPVAEELLRLAATVARMPTISTRSEDEILGLDEHGIPTQ